MSAPEEQDRGRDSGRTQELLLLGQIHGMVQALRDGQEATNARIEEQGRAINARMEAQGNAFNARLEGIDGRLRTVEQRAAVAGAVSGGAMAVGTALIIEGIKAWFRGGGGGGGMFPGP